MGTEGPIIEREEGLRHNATRVLCLVALLSWIAFVILFARSILEVFAFGGAVVDLMEGLVLPMLLFGGAMWLSVSALWLWRRCDRCKRRLFAEGRPNWSRWPKLTEFDRAWHKRSFPWMSETPERDYRARTLLGSYRNRALVDMALTGRLACQWCGHEDGTTPDYVVTARE